MLNLLESLVSIPGTTTGYGLIKYIGPIRGKVGIFAGLELDSSIASTRGRNNGDVEGVHYFDVSIPGAGLFLPWERLRALNPHLPANVRSLSRASSGQDQIGTPSPTSRNIKSRVSSSMGSTDRSSFGRDSPLLAASKLQVPKRRASSKELNKPSHQTTRAVSLSTIGSILTDDNAEKLIDALRSELSDTKALLDMKSRALLEKTAILDDLQNTVDELNPILENYETVVADKDRKMQRQKHDYESAREEWRQSLELMLNAQLESEQLYELELSELKQELASLMNRSAASPKSPSKHRLDDLERQVERLKDENEKLRSKTAAASATISDDEGQMSELKKVVEDARQELALTHAALQTAESQLEAQKAEISLLKANQSEMEKQNAHDLAKRLESMTVQGTRDGEVDTLVKKLTKKNEAQANRIEELEKELEKAIMQQNSTVTEQISSNVLQELHEAQTLISELRHQLEMRPSFEELSELQNSMDEIDHLHQKELLFQKEKISQLQKECNDLKELMIDGKQKPACLPTPLNTHTNGPSLLESSTATLVVASLPSDAIETDILTKPLDVYVPALATDASAGRDNWCGLCEREGHSSLECPYENDMF